MMEGTVAWVPVRTAAHMLGVSRQRVYQLLDDGKLMGRDIDGTILVSQRSIEGRIALLEREGA